MTDQSLSYELTIEYKDTVISYQYNLITLHIHNTIIHSVHTTHNTTTHTAHTYCTHRIHYTHCTHTTTHTVHTPLHSCTQCTHCTSCIQDPCCYIPSLGPLRGESTSLSSFFFLSLDGQAHILRSRESRPSSIP